MLYCNCKYWHVLFVRNILRSVFFMFLWFSAISLSAQDIPFVPLVYNYNAAEMQNAGNQNWSIVQGADGVIYIGNNSGLISFDGANWHLHKLPNGLSVKSVFVDESQGSEKIYVGSYEEFGYFMRDKANQLEYHSLKPFVKDYLFQNDEIWTIKKQDETIYFQSFSSYFTYKIDSETVMVEKPIPSPLYFFEQKGSIFAQFIDDDFYRLEKNKFERLFTSREINNDFIVAVLPNGDDFLMVSSENAIYEFKPSINEIKPWKTELDSEMKTSFVNRAISISDSLIVIGTLNNGLFFMTSEGKLKWHIHRDNGLYNNTVLGLYEDKERNVWAALDNGVSYIRINSGLSLFEPTDIDLGLVEDILTYNNELYLATNHGIYKNVSNRNTMHLLPGFGVQSWYIRRFGNRIITGNNNGTSFVENDKNIVIPTATGGMDIKQATLYNQDVLIESTYSYLYVFRKNDVGQWVFGNPINDFNDLISRIEIDHTGNVWAGHMYKGIYRLRLNTELNTVIEKEYFSQLSTESDAPLSLRVMKLRGRIVFSDTKHFYTYDDIANKIIPYDQLNTELKGIEDVDKIKPVNDTLFWFVRDNEYALVGYSNNSFYVKERIPFSILNSPPNRGRGNVYVSDNGTSYLSLNGGIAQYIPNMNLQANPLDQLRIRSLQTYNRKDGKSHYVDLTKNLSVDFAQNNLSFEFQYTEFSRKTFTIECYLENYDTRWIPADKFLRIDFSNLPANDYTLKVRVINDIGKELSALVFPFRIKNPWYKTAWAYILYILLLLLVVYIFIAQYMQKVIKRENNAFAQQERDRIVQIEKQEKQIATLKNEQLETELTYKSKELASATMNIINQKELLNKLKTELQSLILSGKISKTEGKKLLGLINENISDDDDWAVFKENFDLIYDKFFRNLQEKYPSLTPSDLKLCALLRLNYSSKDVARMLNLSPRGVEAARYRLRKKLLLKEDENLTSFIIDFK